MFLCSIRMSKLKVILAFVLVLAVGIVVTVVLTSSGSDSTEPFQRSLMASTEEERLRYLESFGWTTGGEAVEIAEVVIPTEFDEVYEKYNSLQKTQGFDLEGYKGMTVKRYCYAITNYPGDVPNVYGNLLVHEGQIIGGDICSNELEGFMHGFEM